MTELIKCPRCDCPIHPENINMSCHAHNDKNVWIFEEGLGKEIFVVRRILVLEKESSDETE